jgi:hypothetical protein
MEKNNRKKSGLVWIGWVIGLVVLSAICLRFTLVGWKPVRIATGQELMVDDFGFTIESQRWSDEIPEADAIIKPDGVFLILSFAVFNHAKRVDFTFDPHQVVVEDNGGRRFRLSTDGQAAVDSMAESRSVLAAGQSCRRSLVFDIPDDAENLRARMLFGGRLSEIADWLIYGDRYFLLAQRPIGN